MKKIIVILGIVISILVYFVFIFEQSEYIAGEGRYYTFYEKYQAKEKYIDYDARSYNKDIYNLKRVKNIISYDIEKLDKYRQKMNLYNDSINLIHNSISDYNRYIASLKNLKLGVENQRKIIKNYENDLNDLNRFIFQMEQDLLSIKIYKSEIFEINKYIKYIDSSTNKYSLKIEISKFVAATRGVALVDKIEKEKVRQNELAQIEREKNYELQQIVESSNYDSEYYDPVNKSINYAQKIISEQRRNELLSKTYTIPQIQHSDNSIINIPENNYYYSTNTNSDVEQVRGYVKANGTYVEPYIRTVKNNTEIDNFSFYGNLNPNTGKIGTKK